jgi:hypothetical protein
MRRLHGGGHARARRSLRRAIVRFAMLLVAVAGIVVIIVVLV